MASTRIRTTKDGQTFYEIRVSRGRGRSYLTTRWYPPAGWSQKAIERALTKEAASSNDAATREKSPPAQSKKKTTSGKNRRSLRFKLYGNTAKKSLCLPRL